MKTCPNPVHVIAIRIGQDEGVAFALVSEHLEVETALAYAPGKPVAIQIREWLVDAKSLGSKKTETGRFRTRFRLLNLTRAAREALAAELCASA